MTPYTSKSAFSFIPYFAHNGKELREFWTAQEAEMFAFSEVRTPYPPKRKYNFVTKKIELA